MPSVGAVNNGWLPNHYIYGEYCTHTHKPITQKILSAINETLRSPMQSASVTYGTKQDTKAYLTVRSSCVVLYVIADLSG